MKSLLVAGFAQAGLPPAHEYCLISACRDLLVQRFDLFQIPLCRFFETDLKLICANISEEGLGQTTQTRLVLVDKEETAHMQPTQVFQVEERWAVVESKAFR